VIWLQVRASGTAGMSTQAVEDAEGFGGSGAANPVLDRMGNQLSEFAAHQFVNAPQENAAALTALRCAARKAPNDGRPMFEALSHSDDFGPRCMDATLFAAVQRAMHGAHLSAKVIPTFVPCSGDRQSLTWRCQLIGWPEAMRWQPT
jgi:hypothetical protein